MALSPSCRLHLVADRSATRSLAKQPLEKPSRVEFRTNPAIQEFFRSSLCILPRAIADICGHTLSNFESIRINKDLQTLHQLGSFLRCGLHNDIIAQVDFYT